jgi:hypothetical protein
MTAAPVGNEWYIGNNPSIEITTKGNIEQIYGPGYAVKEDNPLAHLEFALNMMI